jgi:hypothetical protein
MPIPLLLPQLPSLLLLLLLMMMGLLLALFYSLRVCVGLAATVATLVLVLVVRAGAVPVHGE